MQRFACLLAALCLGVSLPAASLAAGPEIFLRDQPEAYLAIDKLAGLGLLKGLMTGDRGLEAREVAREAEKEENLGDPLVDGMLKLLQMEGARGFDFRVRLGAGYSDDGVAIPNAQGFDVPDDGSARGGGFFRYAPADWIGLQGRGEFQSEFSGGTDWHLRETSIRLGWPQATLEGGRFSLWWGPARGGSLLFTTNTEPLTGVRIRNPRPIPVGWWLSFLGAVQYDFFLARLEEHRPVSHSLLSGVRVAVKPKPWLELGASRALHFGGEGQSESLSTFLDILTGQRETEGGTPEGNSLAALDLKIRLPFRVQPVVLYGEAGGEDQSRPGFPTRWAFLGGAFLPSIGSNRRLDLRVEYGDTHTNAPGVWYRHPAYPHTYRGRILGHHMGTDARNLFLEAHYYMLPSSYLEWSADFTERTFPGPDEEKLVRVSGGIVAWVTRRVRAEGRVSVARVRNENGAPEADSTDTAVRADLAWHYR